MLQHLPSRHSNRQVEHSWNPYSRLLCLPTCMNYQDWGQNKGKNYSRGDWLRATHPRPPLPENKLHPWRLSALQLDWVAPCSTESLYSLLQAVNCLSCSFLGITQSCPMIQTEHKAQGYNLHRHKKKKKKNLSRIPQMREGLRKASWCSQKAATEIQRCHGWRDLVTRPAHKEH